MRDGEPLPDPLGLNEAGDWLNPGKRPTNPVPPGTGPEPAAGNSPNAGQYQPRYQQWPWQAPRQGPFPPPGNPDAPPAPPHGWHHKGPIGAIVLIVLGVLFLLGQLEIFQVQLLEFAWPVLLIALGVWLIVRRIGESHGGSK
jgi:hypothetical protein